MSASDTLYTARFLWPEFIERGRDNAITCPVYRFGALVAPASGTVTVTRADQTLVVNAAPVSIVGSVATYTIPAAVLAPLALEEGWLVTWSLVLDGVARTYQRDGALVRRSLFPVVTDADLLRRHSDLNALRAPGVSSYQDYIDEAFAVVQNRLISGGRRPFLVLSPSALREVQLNLTLALIWTDYATSAGDTSRYSDLATHYRQAYEDAWARLNFVYDEADENKVDPNRRAAGTPTMWLGSRGFPWPSGIPRRVGG